ncbi:required for drug-induced death protein 1 [Microcaecilia unicolor]|uniref:Uncharacterized protein C1orf115 homolog n=1 Tax=Microcaecilia unicolor TaxID=1415580 RepID=A0A6P7X8F4_9AMPH|nr:uncharacterized protein C1orf115 homolog [Microcaecilia unicolor]
MIRSRRCPVSLLSTGDDWDPILPPEEREEQAQRRQGHHKVHFASLPDRYELLLEGEEERESKGEKKRRRKKKARKYAKNVGKALRNGCRFLLLGLQSLTNAYAAPFGVSATMASWVHQ